MTDRQPYFWRSAARTRRRARRPDPIRHEIERLEARTLLSATIAAGPRPIATVKPVAGLVTSEDGRRASFTVVLNTRPEHDVTIDLESSNSGEGVPDVSRLVFTPDDWNTPRQVTVAGVSDGVRDGNKRYQIITGAAVSEDPGFDGKPVADVRLVNRDSKTLVADVTVSPRRGLVTTADGAADFFSIVLTYKPSADVTIPVSSGNTSAGLTNVSSVTFTPENWNNPQQVVVTGQGGSFSGRDTVFKVITGPAESADPRYAGINPDDVMVRNRARTIGRFLGTYDGTATGTVTVAGRRVRVNLPLRFDVLDGGDIVLYEASEPGLGPIGSGRVLNNSGAITMAVDNPTSAYLGARFVGNFSIADIRNARGTWRWSRVGSRASGFWNVSRVGGPNPAG